MPEANIGLTGLAVMGQNLVLDMERNGSDEYGCDLHYDEGEGG